ncbi:MAG: hypothetical protein ABI691_14050 [Ginsengibacter sp.]
MPDGKSDCLFGREVHHENKNALCFTKIIAGKNMMAEGKWTGNFLMKVWIE